MRAIKDLSLKATGLFWAAVASFVILSQISLSSLAAEPAALIQARPVVEVSGTQADILLGDMLVIRGWNGEIAEKIRSIRVADAPLSGETRTFTNTDLKEMILSRLSELGVENARDAEFRIPSRVVVSRKKFKFEKSDVEVALKDHFKTLCQDCSFEITGLSLPIIDAKQAGLSSWSIRFRSELPRGNFSLPLDVTDAKGAMRTYWISGTLSVRKNVPVATRSLMMGQSIGPQDFAVQMRDITFATDTAASDTEIENSIAARQIAAGQVIWKNVLRRELSVKFGEPVKVIAGNGEWEVSVEGVSQTSGYVGDLINVRIPRTQKVISGLLKDKGLVEVRQ